MPNIAKKPLHRNSNNIILGERFIIKGLHQYCHRLDRFLRKDLIQKAFSHNKDITSDKFNDNSKKIITSTGQQQVRQHSQHHSLQQGQHFELQHRTQQGHDLERLLGLQHRTQQGHDLERLLGLQHRTQQRHDLERLHGLHHRLEQGKRLERHLEQQHNVPQKERHFGYIFINEIIYLPLA